MWFGRLIIHVNVVNCYGLDVMMGVLYLRDGVEVVWLTLYRLKVWSICLAYQYGVADACLATCWGEAEEQRVGIGSIAHR